MLPTHTSTIHQYTWFQGQCKCFVALLDTSGYIYILKILDFRVKFFKRFNWRVGGTLSRCTYAVHLFNRLGEKVLSNFMPEYLVPELSTQQIHH
jgi:hypothetical protein